MAQKWFFCRTCWGDRIFEWKYRSHGLFAGGHTDWHCTTCDNCDFDTARTH